jgi:Domain of unknown function (DUF222)
MSPMERLARLHGLLDEIHAETVSFATVENAAVYAGLVEQAARKIDALAIGVLDSVGQSGVHKDDGFSTAQSWNAYVCRTTRGETIRRAGLARMFRDLPQTGDAYRAGQIGREQLSTLLNTYRIERCRTQLGESLDMLMGDERRLTAAEFANVMKHWTRLADADGARQKHQTTHEFRDLRIFENFDGGFTLQGSFGALQGATIRELFDRFVQAERLADWDEAREINGDETNSSHLARTEAQRRADAFEAALLQASATLPDANLPEPSVNIAMSPDAFEYGLATLTDTPTVPFDPKNYRNIRCETFSGTQLDPADAVAAAIKGHMRRVVYTTPEASISQKGRFFTGGLRQLLNVIDPSCQWAGCNVPAHYCQGDHTIPWRLGGETRVSNGKPLCQKHNRLKEHGYRTWRDPNGQWHIRRPNGTHIQPAA